MAGPVYTCLWFEKDAEAAAEFYASVLPETRVLERTGPMTVPLDIAGHRVVLLDGGPHYRLSPAASLVIPCEDQSEIDQYWEALLDGGEAQRCGWLVDRYGVSWQIVPTVLNAMLADPDPERAGRVMTAMLEMVKIEIAALEAAREGEKGE